MQERRRWNCVKTSRPLNCRQDSAHPHTPHLMFLASTNSPKFARPHRVVMSPDQPRATAVYHCYWLQRGSGKSCCRAPSSYHACVPVLHGSDCEPALQWHPSSKPIMAQCNMCLPGLTILLQAFFQVPNHGRVPPGRQILMLHSPSLMLHRRRLDSQSAQLRHAAAALLSPLAHSAELRQALVPLVHSSRRGDSRLSRQSVLVAASGRRLCAESIPVALLATHRRAPPPSFPTSPKSPSSSISPTTTSITIR